MLSIELQGVDAMLTRLQDFGRVKARAMLRKALRNGAKTVAEKARQLVPVDSGHLRASIKVRAGKNDKDGVSAIVICSGAGETVDQEKRGDTFRGDAFYGAFVELGHMTGSRKSKDREHVPARPFLRPAFDETRAKVIEQVVDDTNRLINETL